MTAPEAGAALLPALSAIPGVASLAIRDIIGGPVRPGRILGASTHAAWVATEGDVVMLTSAGGPRLPNGVEVISPVELGALLPPGLTVTLGDGALTASVEITVSRWWDPHPKVGGATATEVAARIEGLPDAIDGVPGGDLAGGFESGRTDAVLEAAAHLLGRGTGLTPEADDYLAGILASVRILGPVVGDTQADSVLDAIAGPLNAIAIERTTSLSASLLRHAIRGEVAAPAGAFLRAVCGHGDVAVAHRSVLDIGHSSGPALAAGMVLGTGVVIERAAHERGAVPR